MDRSNSILNNISEAVGNTPLVRLNRIPKAHGIKCEILVKCEFMNPGGSVKDRIGKRMFEKAEAEGLINEGTTILEATSGNTGIGMALLCAAKGYSCCVTMPQKMSGEKVNLMKGLGAEVVRTRTEAKFSDPDSHISVCKQICDNLAPNAFILNQYDNDNNWLAHYDNTANEILNCVDGKLDGIFVGTGTGGTCTGVSKRVKEVIPDCQIYGVDPIGSILSNPDDPEYVKEQNAMPSYKVEGIGYDFVPKNMVRDTVDVWVKSNDHDSLNMARDMLKSEGLLCGGSSGSTVSSCLQWIKENNLEDREDLRFVCFASDTIRNYMTKHLSDEWMVQNGFKEKEIFYDEKHPLAGRTAEICNLRPIPHYDARFTISDALDCFRNGDKMVPLIEESKVKGVLTEQTLLDAIVEKNLNILSSATSALTKDFCLLPYDTDLSILHKMLSRFPAIC